MRYRVQGVRGAEVLLRLSTILFGLRAYDFPQLFVHETRVGTDATRGGLI